MLPGLALALALAAGGNPFLEEAKVHLQALEFERCLERCRQAATQWKSTPDELRELEVTTGLCHFNLGHRRSAFEHFRTALRIDEKTELPPFSSPKALELFTKARDALRTAAEPPPMPDQDLPADAPVERPTLTPKDVKPALLDPAPPSPWARRTAPLVLTGVSAVAVGTAVALGVNATQLANKANQAQFESDFISLAGAARGSATGANVAWAVAGTAAVSAVIAWVVAEH